MKVPLTSYLPEDLAALLQNWGERPYRAQQIFSWIHAKGASSFEEMTDLPLQFRTFLEEKAVILRLELNARRDSPDASTNKYLFRLHDGLTIESVWIEEGKRRTICVSTQVGCPLGCTFCATARMGWARDLNAGEIVEQVLAIQRMKGIRATNIVFMGMGEPFLNYENTIKAAQILSHPKGLAAAARRITISTAGILPSMERYTREGHSFKLAVSLNAPDSNLRTSLMPINRKYTFEKILSAAREYTKTANKYITFEYVIIKGINDSEDNARRLLSSVKGIRCKINLIPYNNSGFDLSRPPMERIEKFRGILRTGLRVVNLRQSKGEEVSAACGQLFTGERKRCSHNELFLNI